jgi:transaldolase/glucose-6-phosphate isomerase
MSSPKSTPDVRGAVTAENPLQALAKFGQSVWLDYIRRDLITTGELARLIKEDGLRGMTSNPSIFEKAIADSKEYAPMLQDLEKEKGLDATAVYERLAVRDIQDAADIMRQVYDATKRRDGYVSLEVSPYLAHRTKETIEEAQRLWKTVGRENVMIKVPGTPEGLPAIRDLIGRGLNINVTLLFAQEVYREVALAYIAGLEDLAARGGDVSRVASVASFFVSRIDTLVDGLLEARIKSAASDSDRARLKGLQGKVAIANAKMAFEIYKEIFSGPRWDALAKRGAQTQRLLWASTSTKNPAYRDVMYVEELIGSPTVDTIPPATLDAFRDHGRPRASLDEGVEQARQTMKDLGTVGISMKQVTDQLTDEGVKLFAEAFDKLLAVVSEHAGKKSPAAAGSLTYRLPDDLAKAVQATLDDWKAGNKVQRLWSGDASLWTNTDEGKWLGWLGIVGEQIAQRAQFEKIAADARAAGFTHVLLLGMGGSSLCVEVMEKTFGKIAGGPKMLVLDSTDPAQVKAVEAKLDLANTLFIVSSKSGSTLEPNIFKQYFYDRLKQLVGAAEVGKHFIAITDPGSNMQKVAEADGFRHVFFGLPSIGGRYSALSDFGMVPAAVQGLDVAKFLDRTQEMVSACGAAVPPDENPGVLLGAILGTLQRKGRDKVTLFTSPGISDLGAWLEQLLAESTGKEGKGLIPVDREDLAEPAAYGKDRVFVYLRLANAPDAKQDAGVEALEKAGQPVVRISVPDIYSIGQEFFRWEIATAVAGSIIGINAFNQPDVEASKIETRKLTSEYEQKGSLPAETPLLQEGGLKLFTDDQNAAALKHTVSGNATVAGYLRAHLNRLLAGDYFALLAFIQMDEENAALLQSIRHEVRDAKRVATCLGFGPRFLHSTGQAYKGGPNSGVFLQVTCDDAADVQVPEQKYTFGVVKAAQARGDLQVLVERKRRALRVHLGSDVQAGLAKLRKAILEALF